MQNGGIVVAGFSIAVGTGNAHAQCRLVALDLERQRFGGELGGATVLQRRKQGATRAVRCDGHLTLHVEVVLGGAFHIVHVRAHWSAQGSVSDHGPGR